MCVVTCVIVCLIWFCNVVLFSLKREASSETYGPRVYFPSYLFLIYCFAFFIFRSIKPKTQKYIAEIYLPLPYFALLFMFYTYLDHISSLQVTVKGLTTPLSRWVQVFVCLCRCYHWRLVCSSYWIDTLVLNWGIYLSLLYCIALSSSREKPTQAQEVGGRISGAVAGEVLHQDY